MLNKARDACFQYLQKLTEKEILEKTEGKFDIGEFFGVLRESFIEFDYEEKTVKFLFSPKKVATEKSKKKTY